MLERWTLQFAAGAAPAKQQSSRAAAARLETSAVYKRLVIMLRSLFSYVRALPAYRLYRSWKVRCRDSNPDALPRPRMFPLPCVDALHMRYNPVYAAKPELFKSEHAVCTAAAAFAIAGWRF